MSSPSSGGRLSRLISRVRAAQSPAKGLEPIPFDPPKDGRLLENYLVNYSVGIRSGAQYSSAFTVYLYESGGRGLYLVKEPYVEPELGTVVRRAIENLSAWLAPSPIIGIDPIGYFFAELERAGQLAGRGNEEGVKAATHYLLRDLLGYGPLDPLIRDPEIEDVSCEGPTRPVKVWHRRCNSNGWLESNIAFPDQERLDAAVARLAHRSNRSVSIASPIVDAVLPEGYRLAATWGREVTSMGSSFSIRKQRTRPYTISELIKLGTLDPKVASYLWTLLEMKGFVIVAGVPASGKTTLINSVAAILNPNWKLLSIEDTREINLPQSGWKPMHTRYSQSGAAANVSLFDLVKLSLRERPDFVILGEARGDEVQALFQAAASGSGCLTTFHASNADGMVARLTQPPLSVARSSLTLIDAVVFMVRDHGGTRRAQEVVEVSADGWVPLFWHSAGRWEGTAEASEKLAVRGEGYGYSRKRLSLELERRSSFLETLVGKGVSNHESLERELRQFYLSSRLTF